MTLSHAKALGANMTEAERRLWYFPRAHRFKGMKFKRQAMIGRYIVDFVSFTDISLLKWMVASMPIARLMKGVHVGSKVRAFAF
jgi:hypothetical protein